MQKQFPFYIFTAAVLVAFILPTLLQDGMDMDGLLYACVSKNLSEGLGTFWFPHLSKTIYNYFEQQPPLGFGIQSLFFDWFGNSMYIERGYSFFAAVINSCLIIILWRTVFRNDQEVKKLAWLPVFFWIIIPVCIRSYSGNLLENTMSIFDLAAVVLIIRFMQTRSFYLLIGSGVFIFLASLTKGIQGMFPLAAIFAGWFAYRNFSFLKTIVYSCLLIIVPFSIYAVLLQNETIYQSLSTYLQNRVLHSIQDVSEVESRFYLIGRLVQELLSVLIISGVIFALWKKKNIGMPPFPYKRHILFFLLIGTSASFPLIITLEQRGFYLVTSFPYFAVAFAAICAPYITMMIEKINVESRGFKFFRIVSMVVLSGSLMFSFMQIGKVGRDAEALHDIHLIGKVVPRGQIVGATRHLWEQWSFGEYLIRHYYICVDWNMKNENDYVILESAEKTPDSIHVEKINIPTTRYHLYKVQK